METMIEMAVCGVVAMGIGALVVTPMLGGWALIEKFDKNQRVQNWLKSLA